MPRSPPRIPARIAITALPRSVPPIPRKEINDQTLLFPTPPLASTATHRLGSSDAPAALCLASASMPQALHPG